MSLPAVNPEALPPISVRSRQWIYAVLFLAVLFANAIDIFFDPKDLGIPIAEPWWLPGALRVLTLLSGAGNLLALANARPTPGEQRVAAAKAELKANGGRVMPAGTPLRVMTRPVPYTHEQVESLGLDDPAEEDGDTREQPRYRGEPEPSPDRPGDDPYAERP